MNMNNHFGHESDSNGSTTREAAATFREGSRELHVCGIGASAGGLEPIQSFFASVPIDLGVAYVVVQHLSPNHDSKMPELLRRSTAMPVELVVEHADGLPIKPDHIYLIPPGKEMVMQNQRLFLSDRSDDQQLTLPIDHFFLSMAQEQGRFGIAVVLSGTGGDGSSGILDVHRSGGLVMAQDPRTSKYDSMPERAIATGICDVVLPASLLADALTRYVRQSLAREQVHQLELAGNTDPHAQGIIEQLREHSKIDFSIYKPKTVLRRIMRRQELIGHTSLESYSRALEKDAFERDSLLADLLIGVTTFYRNRDAFEVLQHEAMTKILGKKEDGDEVRIWVAGCATGEEAYTIAIMFDEAMQRLGKSLRLKLFATDAHSAAIDKASAGVFSAEAVGVLPQEKIEKYFVVVKDRYQVVARIRQQIVFVKHDLMKDAPFTRIDLVTCRNLLIYLQAPAQTKVLGLFHFALSPGGFLFLGSSETIGELEEEFDAVDRKWRLFRKLKDVQLATNRAEANRRSLQISNYVMPGSSGLRMGDDIPISLGGSGPRLSDLHLQKAYDVLLERLLPAGFLIDGNGRLLHTFAGGGEFLHLQSGRHTDDLSGLVHPDLRSSLGAALQHCRRDKKKVVYSGISMGSLAGGSMRQFDLAADPLASDSRGVSLVLISLTPTIPAAGEVEETTRVSVSQASRDGVMAA